MPQIVSFDGLYKLPDQVLSSIANEPYDYIFEGGIWEKSTNGGRVSGAGSTINCTEVYRDQLGQFLDNFSNKPTFFDATCGDLAWEQEFTNQVEYIGGDISGQLIARLTVLKPKLELMHFDITKDVFPRANIWHCRHCLSHLSPNDVYLAFKNFCKSDVSLALIASHFCQIARHLIS